MIILYSVEKSQILKFKGIDSFEFLMTSVKWQRRKFCSSSRHKKL